MTDLIADEARRLLDYDPDTGLLWWKIRPSKAVKVGDVAGTLNAWGYIEVKIKGKMVKATGVAKVDDKVVAQADIMCALMPK